MTTDVTNTALAAVLDALTLVQGQLDTVAKSNARIESTQADILHRLDTIDAGQAGVTDLVPVLETILARLIDDRTINAQAFARTAEVAAFAYSAAMGNRSALPVEVEGDPLLDRFLLSQPADTISQTRALVDWREAVRTAPTPELTSLLAAQYQPSPTDTPESRVLRYRLAAITRGELEGRGAIAPAPPVSTCAEDSSPQAQARRAAELAALWRAGLSTALLADPELTGAVDLFAEVERQMGTLSEEALSEKLASLHRRIGDSIAAGERPGVGSVAIETSDPRPERDPKQR